MHRKSSYDKFTKALSNEGVEIREGRTQRINDIYKQKGVDTLITMDLTKTAAKKDVNCIIIITSDTDFVPVLEEVRKSGIGVILYCYAERSRETRFSIPNHLFKVSTKVKNLTEEHFKSSI